MPSTLDDFYCFSLDEPPRAQRVLLARALPNAVEDWARDRDRVGWSSDNPILLYIYEGTVPVPIFSSGLGDIVMSSPLLEIFERNNFSGALLRKACVYDQLQRRITPTRAGILRAEIGCGEEDRSRGISGRMFNREKCQDTVGIFFDPNTWNGLDVFRCSNNSRVIIHRRVAEILSKANIQNLIIEKVSEYRTHFVKKRAWWYDPQAKPLPRPSSPEGFGTPN